MLGMYSSTLSTTLHCYYIDTDWMSGIDLFRWAYTEQSTCTVIMDMFTT